MSENVSGIARETARDVVSGVEGISAVDLQSGVEENSTVDNVVTGDNRKTVDIFYCDFVKERRDSIVNAFASVRNTLGVVAERSKKYYDMRVKPASFAVGDWVYYFCPRHRVGRTPKWQRFYSGPYLVTELLGRVNLRIQRTGRANPMVVHIDKVKKCFGPTPKSWLSEHLLTETDGDVLNELFRSSDDLVERSDETVNKTVHKKRKEAGLSPVHYERPSREIRRPARFVNKVYCVTDVTDATDVADVAECKKM